MTPNLTQGRYAAPASSCGFLLSTKWYFVIYACNPSRPGQNDKVKDGAIQNLGGKLVVLAPAAASNQAGVEITREESVICGAIFICGERV